MQIAEYRYTMTENLKASELITLKEAAERFGLSPASLRRYAWEGRLKAQKFGNTWVTTIEAVEGYLASRQRKRSPRKDLTK